MKLSIPLTQFLPHLIFFGITLALLGQTNWQLSLALLGILIIYYLPRKRYLVFVASFLVLFLPFVWWYSENWANLLAIFIYFLLLFYLLFTIFSPQPEQTFSLNLNHNQIFIYLFYPILGLFIVLMPLVVIKEYSNFATTNHPIKITINSTPALNQNLDITINNPEQSDPVMINLIRPDRQIRSFQINKKQTELKLQIFSSELNLPGAYQIIATNRHQTNNISFQINGGN